MKRSLRDNCFCAFATLALLAGHGRACAMPQAAVVTYETAPDAIKSKAYSLTANGTQIYVEHFQGISYARFSVTEGELRIVVTVNTGISSYRISPQKHLITPVVQGTSLTFAAPGVHKHLLVKVNDLEDLLIFFDPPETDRPKPTDANVTNIMSVHGVDSTGERLCTSEIQQAVNSVIRDPDKDILYFPKGVYRCGSFDVNGSMKIYLADGAVLKGAQNVKEYSRPLQYNAGEPVWIMVRNAPHFQLYGRGTVDGEGKSLATDDIMTRLIDLIEVANCNNATIKDVVLRNPSNWSLYFTCCDNTSALNVKALTLSHLVQDGFDVSNSSNIHFKNCFAYSFDDCFAVMTRENKCGRRETKNILVEDCVGRTMCSGARLGWHSHALITDVVFKNCDFLYCRLQPIAMHHLNAGAHYGTITFQNVNWEDNDQSGTFFSHEGPGLDHSGLNTVTAEELKFIGCTMDKKPAWGDFAGTVGNGINRLTFQNLMVDGVPVRSPQELQGCNFSWSNVASTSVQCDAKFLNARKGNGWVRNKGQGNIDANAPSRMFTFVKNCIETPVARFAPVTLEAWVVPSALPPAGCFIIGSDIRGSHGIGLALHGPNLAFEYLVGYEVSNASVPMGRQTHVAAVFGPDNTRLYRSGELIHTGAATKSYGNTPFVIGQIGSTNPDAHFAGQIRCVRISKGERYRDNFAPPESFKADADSVVIYDAKRVDGRRIIDLSGKGNHGAWR
jgi:polygalacturonase